MKIKTIMYEVKAIQEELNALADRLSVLNDYLLEHVEQEETEPVSVDDLDRELTPEELRILKDLFGDLDEE